MEPPPRFGGPEEADDDPRVWETGTTRYLAARVTALLLGWRWPSGAPGCARLGYAWLLALVLAAQPVLLALRGGTNPTFVISNIVMALPPIIIQALSAWRVGARASSADHTVAGLSDAAGLAPAVASVVLAQAFRASVLFLAQVGVLTGAALTAAPNDPVAAALAGMSALGSVVTAALFFFVGTEAALIRLLIESSSRAGDIPPQTCIRNHQRVREVINCSRDRWGTPLGLAGTCWAGIAVLYLFSLAVSEGYAEQLAALALAGLASILVFTLIWILASASREAEAMLSRTVDAQLARAIDEGSTDECLRLGLLVQYAATHPGRDAVYTILSVPVTFDLIGRIIPLIASAGMIALRQVLVRQSAADPFYYMD
jgi:hypothetical protein